MHTLAPKIHRKYPTNVTLLQFVSSIFEDEASDVLCSLGALHTKWR